MIELSFILTHKQILIQEDNFLSQYYYELLRMPTLEWKAEY